MNVDISKMVYYKTSHSYMNQSGRKLHALYIHSRKERESCFVLNLFGWNSFLPLTLVQKPLDPSYISLYGKINEAQNCRFCLIL